MSEQICKVTGTQFKLSSQEQDWYARFSLPPPDLLREERLRRKLAFINTHSFQWRTIGVSTTSENGSSSPQRIYTAFSHLAPFRVIPLNEWRSLDLRESHFDFISRKPFFEQLHEAWKGFPRPDCYLVDCKDASACHLGYQLDRCFSVSASDRSDQSMYSVGISQCSRCIDCLFVSRSSNCYECVDCRECYSLRWGLSCERVVDSWFMFNCSDCKDCLFCEGINGAQYCVFNKQLSQEDFLKAKRNYHSGTQEGLEQMKNLFAEFLQGRAVPHRLGSIFFEEELSGNGLWESKEVWLSFYVDRCKSGLGLLDCVEAEGVLDVLGGREILNCAQSVSIGGSAKNVINALYCWGNLEDVRYSAYCTDSRHLFGCFGLHGREYCIGNQQYTKSEYQTVYAQIQAWLDTKRVSGKFFPSGFSDYPYNHSAAQDFFPLNKFQAEMLGFRWDIDEEVKPSQLLQGAEDRILDIPSRLADIDRTRLSHHLYLCEWSARPFQLTAAEVDFYVQQDIAPPRKCFEERHRERVSQLGGLKLSPIEGATPEEEADESFFTPFNSNNRRPIIPRPQWLAERGIQQQ